jgi:LuxR family maltose regulon positive regulatory protein
MWVALARVSRERGHVEEVARHLDTAGDLGEAAGLPQQPYRWRVAMANLREAQGDVESAAALLAEAQGVFNSDFSPDVRPLPAVRARLDLRTGDVLGPRRWAVAAGVTPADDLAYLREYEHITLARLLLAEHTATGDPAGLEQALALLGRLHGAAAAAGRTAAAVETSLLLALAHDAGGDGAEAMRRLQHAVRITASRGWVRPLIDAGPRVRHLLARLPEGAAFGEALSAADPRTTPARAPRPTASGAAGAGSRLVVPLSSRELDVLRLLASDLDGPAIARHLNVSLPTVRSHTQHIYAKLGVNSRRAAVRRAHQLNL